MTSIIKVLAIITSLVTGTLAATGSASAGADSPYPAEFGEFLELSLSIGWRW